MNFLSNALAVLVVLALLAALGAGGYVAFQYIVALFARLDPQVADITAIACLVALASAWMIARGIRTASRENKARALREEKAATYQLFVDFWENLLRLEPARTDQVTAELSEKLQLLDRLLALYGGTAVIKAHAAMRELAHDKSAHHPDVRRSFGEALVAIRKDLGTDTPRDTAHELERLLLPALNAGGGGAEPKDAQVRSALAPNA